MKDLSSDRGASALVLSGELTEGTSDLSQAMTAPGGVPALPEVNQSRAHPEAPEVAEQPRASYRRIVESGSGGPGAGNWMTVSPASREGHMPGAGPATQIASATRAQAQNQARKQSKNRGAGNA